MTKLSTKILEREKPLTVKDVDNLEGGDMVYSHTSDMLIMIVRESSNLDKYSFIDLNNGEILVEEDEHDAFFEDVFSRLNDDFGPFYPVKKVKFKVTV